LEFLHHIIFLKFLSFNLFIYKCNNLKNNMLKIILKKFIKQKFQLKFNWNFFSTIIYLEKEMHYSIIAYFLIIFKTFNKYILYSIVVLSSSDSIKFFKATSKSLL